MTMPASAVALQLPLPRPSAHHPAPTPEAGLGPKPGGPLCIVINAGSGRDVAGERLKTLQALLEEHALRHRVFVVPRPGDLNALARQAVAVAEAEDGIIVAAGGDGTLNAVVQFARHSRQPFAILPQGTFNYFGRSLGISSDLRQSVPGLKDGELVEARIGLVNDHAFLVNASLGLYPDLLERREADKQRFGRSRTVAFFSAARTLLSPHPCLALRIADDQGQVRILRTPTLFVGNNALQLKQVGIAEADAVEQGQLAGVLVREVDRRRLLGLLLRGAIGRLGQAEAVDTFAFQELTVQTGRSGRHGLKLACDGETLWLRPPLTFRIAPRPLRMWLPRQRVAGDPG